MGQGVQKKVGVRGHLFSGRSRKRVAIPGSLQGSSQQCGFAFLFTGIRRPAEATGDGDRTPTPQVSGEWGCQGLPNLFQQPLQNATVRSGFNIGGGGGGGLFSLPPESKTGLVLWRGGFQHCIHFKHFPKRVGS